MLHPQHREQLAANLWKAVSENDEQQVESLLQKGANPNCEFFSQDKWKSRFRGYSLIGTKVNSLPLGMACLRRNLSVVKLLIEKGKANQDERSSVQKCEAPLHEACYIGSLDIVKYLVKEARCYIGESLSLL